MLRFITAFLSLVLLTTCSNDPLKLHIVELEQPTLPTELLPFEPVSLPANWSQGDGVINSVGTGDLPLLSEHEDLSLEFSYQLTEDAEATLWLAGRYPVSLTDLSIIGPSGNVYPEISKKVSPGVWQELEVVFKAASEGVPALLVAVYLNGNLAYYQQEIIADDKATQSGLVVELTSGTAKFADFRLARQAGKNSSLNAKGEAELNLPLVRYRYYDLPKGTKDVTRWAGLEPDKSGYINRFDLNAIRDKGQDYAIRFDGDLEIPKAGTYTFTSWSPASSRMYIDEQLIVDNGGKHDAKEETGTIDLAKGKHRVVLDHVQNGGWNATRIEFMGPDENEGNLNSMDGNLTIATPETKDVLEVEMDDAPYLLRSFLYFPKPKAYEIATKRTHVISVGEKTGPHYSLDLQSGSLLQVWKGGFANVYEMWANRGEPQTMSPLGNAIMLDGKPQWYHLQNEQTPWPDSLHTKDDFRHLHHELDEQGRPTFFYALNGKQVSDQIKPTEHGINRKLHNYADEALYTQLAAATHIAEISPGIYELRKPGLLLRIMHNEGGKLVLQRGGGVDRLLAKVSPAEHVIYQLEW